jgi:putative SOS response-associated peptidase YedK
MCGRFAQCFDVQATADWLEAESPAEQPPPRYNLAPGSRILACRSHADGRRELASFHWGLIPGWAKDRKFGNKTFNARAETVAEKPSFRAAFRQRRCLIPADVFYEWKTVPGGKQPFAFRRRDEQPMTFAGLWEQWADPTSGERLDSATIIVTNANPLVAAVHDRMPVILDPAHWAEWLDPGHRDRAKLAALLQPCPGDVLIGYPVDPAVGHPRCDGPAYLEPTGPLIDVAADQFGSVR